VNTANSTPKSSTKLTPRQIADRNRISVDKVLAWIHTGQLRAVNVATRPGGRPRWRISEADLACFEATRAAVPAPPTRQRPKKEEGVIPYF
jgi:excisionase family DNA binding protein